MTESKNPCRFSKWVVICEAGVEFRRELRESIWILLGGVCKSLWTFFHSVCVKLLTVYVSVTGFTHINLARMFARVDFRTRVKILALVERICGLLQVDIHDILERSENFARIFFDSY